MVKKSLFYVMRVGNGGDLSQTMFIDVGNCVWTPVVDVFGYMSFEALKCAYGAPSANSGLAALYMILRYALTRLNKSKIKMTAFAA